MRRLLLASAVPLFRAVRGRAQVDVGIGINLPGVSIGLNLPAYPELVRVPGYPVYDAPSAGANVFFYDGLYWVYQADNWYASSWYNRPWRPVGPEYVPLYVLRVPVRYYRQPPVSFRGWRADSPPRWGDHWGRDWEQRREGWDRWDCRAAPPPAPLPSYQRRYAGDRYPGADEQQRSIRSDHHRYQPRDDATRQHLPPPQDSRSQPGRSEDNGRDARPRPNDKAHGKGNEDRGQDRQ